MPVSDALRPEALMHAKNIEAWACADYGLRGNELRAAAAELRRLSALEAGWQPIATAPKDGVGVLCCQALPDGFSIQFVGYYDGAGWRHIDFRGGDEAMYEPTHWRALPPSPTSPPDGTGGV